MHRRRTAAALAVALLTLVPLAAVSAAPATSSALKGSAPSWANSKNLVKAADPGTVVGFRVYLGWTNPAGAAKLARSVSDPKSASYGKYMTPAQFRHQFSPSQATVGAVQSWLKGQGFTVNYTPSNNHYVSAEGTLAQAAAAFKTTFNLYQVSGKTVRAPSSVLSVPASLAPVVDAVVGLDQSDEFVIMNHTADKLAAPSAGFRNAPPLSDYWAQQVSSYAYPTGFTDRSAPATAPWVIKGNTPAMIKGAYGISGTYDGTGQTVAIIDAFASPTILADVNRWSANRGLPTMTNGQLAQVVPPGIYRRAENKQMDPSGWNTEETLDVEAVHGMAPGAKIVYVGAPNNRRDLDAALNHVIDGRLAQIVTNSYGYATELLPPGFEKPINDMLIQAAAEGIGVYFSSGDSGDETSRFGFATTEFPTSSPWVTAVGGTALAVGSSNQRVFETGWGTSSYACDKDTLVCTRLSWTGGAGGGFSRIFARPWYQDGVVSNPGRGVPDVAALADPQTGFLIGQTQSFPDGRYYDEFRLGGTSLASPIFAGLMALSDQQAGFRHGFANPAFYANPGSFTDVLSIKTAVARRNFVNSVSSAAGTSDFLRTFDDYSGSPTQHTGPGWDDVTGLGTMDGIFPAP
jgi:subtilase family serine protease